MTKQPSVETKENCKDRLEKFLDPDGCFPCAHCDSELFTTEVDINFLYKFKQYFDQLNKIKPNWYTTEYQGKEIDDAIERAIKQGKTHKSILGIRS